MPPADLSSLGRKRKREDAEGKKPGGASKKAKHSEEQDTGYDSSSSTSSSLSSLSSISSISSNSSSSSNNSKGKAKKKAQPTPTTTLRNIIQKTSSTASISPVQGHEPEKIAAQCDDAFSEISMFSDDDGEDSDGDYSDVSNSSSVNKRVDMRKQKSTKKTKPKKGSDEDDYQPSHSSASSSPKSTGRAVSESPRRFGRANANNDDSSSSDSDDGLDSDSDSDSNNDSDIEDSDNGEDSDEDGPRGETEPEDDRDWVRCLAPDTERVRKEFGIAPSRAECFACERTSPKMISFSAEQFNAIITMIKEQITYTDLIDLTKQIYEAFEETIRNPANERLCEHPDREAIPEWKHASIFDHITKHMIFPEFQFYFLTRRINLMIHTHIDTQMYERKKKGTGSQLDGAYRIRTRKAKDENHPIAVLKDLVAIQKSLYSSKPDKMFGHSGALNLSFIDKPFINPEKPTHFRGGVQSHVHNAKISNA